ncbi:transposase [Escherichia coli]|uniref:transposase n=1 Tax=Escherichia coli TaxID=562 RepID=UPI000AB17E99
MKKTRYTDEQTIYALKQAKTGICSGEICRRMNIFETTFYIYIYGLRYFGK